MEGLVLKKKQIIIIAAVILVALIGIGAYAMSQDDGADKSNTSSNTSSNNSGNQPSSFDALTTDTSFVATITTSNDGQEVKAVMSYDKDSGAVKYVTTTEGKEVSMYYTKDAYYLCQSANDCFKYPLGQGSVSGFDPGTYQYDNQDIAGLRNNAAYQGQQSCPAGTCDVWKVTEGTNSTTVYIDASTKRISQVETTTAAGTSKVVYEYKSVSVTPPANAKELPLTIP